MLYLVGYYKAIEQGNALYLVFQRHGFNQSLPRTSECVREQERVRTRVRVCRTEVLLTVAHKHVNLEMFDKSRSTLR
jgi:hypothetical protein